MDDDDELLEATQFFSKNHKNCVNFYQILLHLFMMPYRLSFKSHIIRKRVCCLRVYKKLKKQNRTFKLRLFYFNSDDLKTRTRD